MRGQREFVSRNLESFCPGKLEREQLLVSSGHPLKKTMALPIRGCILCKREYNLASEIGSC